MTLTKALIIDQIYHNGKKFKTKDCDYHSLWMMWMNAVWEAGRGHWKRVLKAMLRNLGISSIMWENPSSFKKSQHYNFLDAIFRDYFSWET